MNTTTNLATYAGRRWPDSWSERALEYESRRRTYLGLGYTDAERIRLGLFVATDTAGRIVHETRRILRDPAFVADVDATALANGIVLGVKADVPDGERQLAQAVGDEVWERSKVDARAERWGRMCSVYGDLHLEVMTDDEGHPMFAAHKPQHVRVYYDAQGLELESAVIEFDHDLPPGTVNADSGPTVRYRRILTRESVRVEQNGKIVADAQHGLGVVPLVHVQFRPLDESEFSLCAFSGLEDPTAVADSVMTQVAVIGGRHAAPWLKIMGAILDSGQDPTTLGKTLNLPVGVEADYLVAPMEQLTALVEQVRALREQITQTCPEFLFVDAGANASGTSLSYRAGAFKAKIEPAMWRFREGIATAVGIAVALARGVPFDDSSNVYEVDGPPALPEDRRAIFDLYRDAMEAGALKLRDMVQTMQAAGIIPADLPPEEYAEQAAAEHNARNAEVVELANRIGRDGMPERVAPVGPVPPGDVDA